MYSSKLIYILNSLYNKHTLAHTRKYLFSDPLSKYVFKRNIKYYIHKRRIYKSLINVNNFRIAPKSAKPNFVCV